MIKQILLITVITLLPISLFGGEGLPVSQGLNSNIKSVEVSDQNQEITDIQVLQQQNVNEKIPQMIAQAQTEDQEMDGVENEVENMDEPEEDTIPAESEESEEPATRGPLIKSEKIEDEPSDEPFEDEPPFIEDVTDEISSEEKSIVGPKKVTIDLIVTIDYQFFDSPDAFKVKYHLNMGGKANLSTAVIRGDAEIATEVTGFLAKWPQGQCALNVSIAKVPYEIKYNQAGGDEADISVAFKKDITEVWESNCTFMGVAAKPFKTEGPPEKWITDALKKTIPPITSLVAPLEAGELSSTKFEIPEYTVIEENLGNAKVKGTGIISIEPSAAPGAKGGPSSALRELRTMPTRQTVQTQARKPAKAEHNFAPLPPTHPPVRAITRRTPMP